MTRFNSVNFQPAGRPDKKLPVRGKTSGLATSCYFKKDGCGSQRVNILRCKQFRASYHLSHKIQGNFVRPTRK